MKICHSQFTLNVNSVLLSLSRVSEKITYTFVHISNPKLNVERFYKDDFLFLPTLSIHFIMHTKIHLLHPYDNFEILICFHSMKLVLAPRR
jgi:hypothetical protein